VISDSICYTFLAISGSQLSALCLQSVAILLQRFRQSSSLVHCWCHAGCMYIAQVVAGVGLAAYHYGSKSILLLPALRRVSMAYNHARSRSGTEQRGNNNGSNSPNSPGTSVHSNNRAVAAAASTSSSTEEAKLSLSARHEAAAAARRLARMREESEEEEGNGAERSAERSAAAAGAISSGSNSGTASLNALWPAAGAAVSSSGGTSSAAAAAASAAAVAERERHQSSAELQHDISNSSNSGYIAGARSEGSIIRVQSLPVLNTGSDGPRAAERRVRATVIILLHTSLVCALSNCMCTSVALALQCIVQRKLDQALASAPASSMRTCFVNMLVVRFHRAALWPQPQSC
jgi:hypothetical protein